MLLRLGKFPNWGALLYADAPMGYVKPKAGFVELEVLYNG
jgi:hypothetical protein